MMIEITFIKQVFRFSAVAALLYCVTVFFYIRSMQYEDTYMLFVGNFLFAAVIAIFIAWFYKKHQDAIGTIRLVVIGGKAAMAGIAIACVLIPLLLLVLAPGVFQSSPIAENTLQGAPANFAGKNNGFAKMLFLSAVVGNAGASFFISLLIPFSVMKNIYPGERKRKNKWRQEEDPKRNYHLLQHREDGVQ